jgi:hypothetical protein
MKSTEGSFIVVRGITSFLVALLFVATSVEVGVAQRDPLIGTWKLNPAKSKYSPGPPVRNETVTYEAAGQGLKYAVTQIDAEGKSTALEGSLIYDGKDYPARGTQDYDMVATRRIDANTGATARKKNGKIVQTVMRVLSKDGKTLTLTTKGVDARGQSIDNVAVYERQ